MDGRRPCPEVGDGGGSQRRVQQPGDDGHYTHIGELAAGLAVAALPSVIGEAAPAPVVNGHDPEAILTKLRGILDGMGAGNWEEKRAEALALLAKVAAAAIQRQN